MFYVNVHIYKSTVLLQLLLISCNKSAFNEDMGAMNILNSTQTTIYVTTKITINKTDIVYVSK